MHKSFERIEVDGLLIDVEIEDSSNFDPDADVPVRYLTVDQVSGAFAIYEDGTKFSLQQPSLKPEDRQTFQEQIDAMIARTDTKRLLENARFLSPDYMLIAAIEKATGLVFVTCGTDASPALLQQLKAMIL